ncbi:MAG: hypothetical protein ACI9LM_003993 [Alteromonadaceae bacterium]|jgi:hypothetical protein
MNEENSPLNEKSQVDLQAEQQSKKLLDVTSLPAADNSEEKPETSVLDEQWAAITQDWQTQPVPKTDIIALLKQTKRRTLWAKVCLGLNIVFTVGIVIVFVIGLYSGKYGTPMNSFLGFAGIGGAIFIYYEIKIRLKAWRQCCDSPDKAIEHAISACQSSINYMILNKLSCIPYIFVGNWFVVVMALENDKPLWKGLVFVNFFLVVAYVVADRIHKKRKKEHHRLKSLK